jgi:hypothetical protein
MLGLLGCSLTTLCDAVLHSRQRGTPLGCCSGLSGAAPQILAKISAHAAIGASKPIQSHGHASMQPCCWLGVQLSELAGCTKWLWQGCRALRGLRAGSSAETAGCYRMLCTAGG